MQKPIQNSESRAENHSKSQQQRSSAGGPLGCEIRAEEMRLIRQLLNRERSAWFLFVERYQGLVYARVVRTAEECHRKLNRADVEDLCAEVFTGLLADDFSGLRRFEGRSRLGTWLSVVARRVCLRHFESKRVDRSWTVGIEADGLAEGGAAGTHDALAALVDAEDQERLNRMLARLKESDRTVLRYFYMQSLTYAEIAERMRISTNAVGPKLKRAQRRLRGLMEQRQSFQELTAGMTDVRHSTKQGGLSNKPPEADQSARPDEST